MATTASEHDGDTTEARALRHESRAGSTYAQFIRDVAERGGYTKQAAERYVVGTLTTLEERLPIAEVRALESQLPTRLDGILAFQPVLALPTIDQRTFCWRFAVRVGVPEEEAPAIVRLVFRCFVSTSPPATSATSRLAVPYLEKL